jgi:transcription elongation factor Elf1
LGKNLDLQIKREAAYQHKQSKQKYKGPYDCPKCYYPKALNVKSLKKTETIITWIVWCDKCNLWETIEMPRILGQIDVFNKIQDKVKRK